MTLLYIYPCDHMYFAHTLKMYGQAKVSNFCREDELRFLFSQQTNDNAHVSGFVMFGTELYT